jgi:hypothetical protein
MLVRTKGYASEPPQQIDPIAVEFSVENSKDLRGQLPWKGGKYTADIYNLGKLLIKYCEAPQTQRPMTAAHIGQEADALLRSLAENSGD